MGLSPTSGGGASAGIAQGRIVIDTQSLAAQRGQVIRESRLMGQSLKREIGDGATKGVNTAVSSLGRLSGAINNVSKSLGVMLGAIAGIGTASALHVKRMNLLFRTLVGNEEEAIEKMAMLRDMADKSHQPFLQLVEGATAIIPALRGTNGELDKTLMLVQRLAILDPVQGVAGGAFAIREFLSGEYLSLVKRMELDKSRLKAITAEADGDAKKAIDGLSDYIDEMGLTEQAMFDMGQSGVNAFAIMRDEGTQTLADFFEPFLNDFVIPLTQGLGAMLRELRDVNPELKKFVGISAGLAGTAAIAGSTLPGIGRIPGGATLGRAVGVGAAAYGGAHLGTFATRQLANAGVGGGFERFEGKSQGEVMGELSDILKAIAGMLIVDIAKWVKILIDFAFLLEEPFNDLKDVVADLADGIQKAIDKIDNLLGTGDDDEKPGVVDIVINPVGTITKLLGDGDQPTGESMASIRAKRISPEEQAAIDHWERLGTITGDAGVVADLTAGSFEKEKSAADKAKDSVDDFTVSILEGLGIIDEAPQVINPFFEALGNMVGGLTDLASAGMAEFTKDDLKITDELLDAWEEHQNDLSELDEQYQNDTEQELADHEERKAGIIADYQQRVTDILEAEAIRYERALRSAHDREADIRKSLIDTIADTNEALADSLRDLAEEKREAEEDALENHLDKLKDIRDDGQDALLRAAMNFDGRAIWEAQRSQQQRTEDEQESYQKEREDRQEKYDDAIADAIEAHDEQIALAHESAQEQIQILWQRFNKEEQMRREDTQRRLQKMQRDHAERMTELNREHVQRINDMRTKYGQERSAMLTAFAQDLMDKNTHLGNLRQIESDHRRLLEIELNEWWNANRHLYMIPVATGTVAPTITGGHKPAVYHSGGRISQDGLINAQKDEHMLSRSTTNTLQRMLGGNLTQAGLVSAVGGGQGGTYNLTANVNVTGGAEDSDIGEIVRSATLETMMEVAQKIETARGKIA